MKTIQNAASGIFIGSVGVLSLISIFGVWDVFGRDVISKSFETLTLLAVVAAVVRVASRFVGSDEVVDPNVPEVPNQTFRMIRIATLGVLIVSAALLALLGVFSIWEIITDKDTLYKALSSLAIIAFSSFIIVMTCLEREGSKLLKRGGNISPVVIIVCIILFFWMLSVIGSIF